MLDAGYWILDSGYWMLDAGYWILDTGTDYPRWLSELWLPISGFGLSIANFPVVQYPFNQLVLCCNLLNLNYEYPVTYVKKCHKERHPVISVFTLRK